MRVLLVVLAMLCATLGAAAVALFEQHRQQAEEITLLKAQGLASRASLEDQSRCAAHTEKLFKELGRNDNIATPEFQSYTGHYSVQQGKCFMLIETSAFPALGDNVEDVRMIYLYDAVERRSYGEFIWMSSKDKKNSEVKPMMCRTAPSASAEDFCDSEGQFREFVAKYME